ncbi:UDP-N-acetylglucosamine 2-epimerase (non-hydrolysing) [Methanophagales archaeon]|nr:UDP-N-acetylglucosamine 2-epimerase (non-hydrolysing) [Methanophagales archaeon]
MNKVFFDELKIPEHDYHLGVGSGMHGYQTGEILKRTEEELLKEASDLVFCDATATAVSWLDK